MFNVALFVALLLSCCLFISEAIAVPFERRAAARVVVQCTVPKTVALTFDDGAYDYLNDVVDTLKAAGAKGTFFFNGYNWRCIYDDASVKRVQYAYNNGFQVASHTWAHKHLTNLTGDQVNSEMAQTEDAIRRITGAIPAFTRPPYGEYNDVTVQVAGARNQILANWDFDSQDSLGATVDQQKKFYDDLVSRRPSNVISLQHEVYSSSVHQVLPYAIKVLQGAGYQLVTLAECLNMNPYLQTGTPSPRDDTWHC
ncbi:carbohydrate esterase family 4 protein [Phlegmacium glaucopus]|nr:carbohydrate esterase family 4 protein [Phlegmacium glaucopus]